MDASLLAEQQQQPDGTAGPVSSSFRRRTFDFLEAKGTKGLAFEYFTIVLIWLNVFTFALGTDKEINHHCGNTFGLRSWVDDNKCSLFQVVEIATVAVFTVEYAFRFWASAEDPDTNYSRLRYAYSFFSLVDLVAIVPFYLDLCLPQDLPSSQFLRLFRMFRMLRVEGRFRDAFDTFDDVLSSKKQLLITTGFVGLAIWIIISALYYLAEKDNKDMDGKFCSIASSSYFTLVNLFGEFPEADNHSNWGKVIGIFVQVVAVAVFGIPTAILGDGFQEAVEEYQERVNKKKGDDEEAREARKAELAEQEKIHDSTFKVTLWRFLHAKTDNGLFFEIGMNSLIMLSVLAFLLETCTVISDNKTADRFLNTIEAVSVIIFTIEYLARLYCAGAQGEGIEDPEGEEGTELSYRGVIGKFRFMCSFYALIDLASVLPWWINLCMGNGSSGSTFFRAMRLIRMLKADQYEHAFDKFDDVILMNKDMLMVTGFAALVMWIFFSSLMYFTEYKLPHTPNNELLTAPDVLTKLEGCLRGVVDPPSDMPSCDYPLSDTDIPCGDMDTCINSFTCNCIPYQRYRYRSVPAAMWMTLLNLTGEVPLDAYTKWGKVISGLMGIIAVASFSIPVGLLGGGFESMYLEGEGDDEDDEREDEESDAPKPKKKKGNKPKPSGTAHQKQVFEFVNGDSENGWWFHNGIAVLIVLNVVMVILESEDSITNHSGVSTFFDIFEWTSVIIFTVEFGLRLYSAGFDKRADYSVKGYMLSFFGVVDMLAIFPCYIEGILKLSHVHFNAMIFRVFRIFRILLLEHFIEAFTLLDDAYRKCKETLAATGLLAIIIWVGCATLFYIFEANNDNPDYVESFRNIPNSFYYVAVFTGGEWAKCDFTVPGKLVAQFLAIAGIALYAIPIGAFFEAFQGICEDEDDDEDEVEEVEEVEENLITADTENQMAAAASRVPASGDDSGKFALLEFLNGHTTSGFYFEAFILLLIILSVVYAALSTVDSIGEPRGLEIAEGMIVGIFTIEYLLRLYAIVEDPEFKTEGTSNTMARLKYVVSFYAVVDLLAIWPWYLQYMASGSDFGDWMDDHDKELRMFRMLRLLKLDKYVPSVTLIDDAVRAQKSGLKIACYMAIIFWIIFASLLYMTEKDNTACPFPIAPDDAIIALGNSTWKWAVGDCVCAPKGMQLERFNDVPNAMTYTMYHLTGDYPLTDYTFWGKAVNFFMVLFAVSIVAIPSGLIANGFQEVVEDSSKARIEARQRKLGQQK
jgi:hypothetical protein